MDARDDHACADSRGLGAYAACDAPGEPARGEPKRTALGRESTPSTATRSGEAARATQPASDPASSDPASSDPAASSTSEEANRAREEMPSRVGASSRARGGGDVADGGVVADGDENDADAAAAMRVGFVDSVFRSPTRPSASSALVDVAEGDERRVARGVRRVGSSATARAARASLRKARMGAMTRQSPAAHRAAAPLTATRTSASDLNPPRSRPPRPARASRASSTRAVSS